MRSSKKIEQEKRHVLSYPLFEGAKKYTDDSVKLASAPHAPHGANADKIYMPQDLPIVIRVCKNERDFSRFPKMTQARTICSEENKFHHLVVPKARLQGNFIIEERVPSKDATTIKGMAFYYENREFYTEAVKEFTSFLCYGYLDDIVGGNKHKLNYLGLAQVPRFDNLLLYAAEDDLEKLCKIGIIDIETFRLNSSKPSDWNVYYALSSSVQLFPYHFEVIIDTGKTFCDVPQEAVEALRAESLKSKQLYKIVCEDNLSFYQRHQITLENQILVSITLERREELKKLMGSFLHKMHDRGFNQDCLNGNPDEIVHYFQDKLFPKMITSIETRFSKISSFSAPSISLGELIERRAVFNGFTSGLAQRLENDEVKLIKEIFKDDFPPTFRIFEKILKELVKGGELSYYKAHVYSSDDVIFF